MPEHASLPRLTIGAYYDDKTGRCTSLDISIDRDLGREDIIVLLRAAFQPIAFTQSDPRAAATEILPNVRVNDQKIAGSEFWNKK